MANEQQSYQQVQAMIDRQMSDIQALNQQEEAAERLSAEQQRRQKRPWWRRLL